MSGEWGEVWGCFCNEQNSSKTNNWDLGFGERVELEWIYMR